MQEIDILNKDADHLPQVFFKHFASENQLPGLSKMGWKYTIKTNN